MQVLASSITFANCCKVELIISSSPPSGKCCKKTKGGMLQCFLPFMQIQYSCLRIHQVFILKWCSCSTLWDYFVKPFFFFLLSQIKKIFWKTVSNKFSLTHSPPLFSAPSLLEQMTGCMGMVQCCIRGGSDQVLGKICSP